MTGLIPNFKKLFLVLCDSKIYVHLTFYPLAISDQNVFLRICTDFQGFMFILANLNSIYLILFKPHIIEFLKFLGFYLINY